MRLDREQIHIDVAIEADTRVLKPKSDIPEKLLRIMRKYKYNWRLDQLAKPRLRTEKFTPPDDEVSKRLEALKAAKLSAETKYYADNLSKPMLKCLYENQRLSTSKKLRKRFERNIKKAWESKYNYYRKQERNKKIRQWKREQKQKPKQKEPDWKRYDDLCKPKTIFKPEPLQKKPKKIFDNYDRLEDLAAPKPYIMEPPKIAGVSPAALEYEPTENILKLAAPPERFRKIEKPLEPGAVKRSALRYKASPRIGEIAQPKQRADKIKEEETADPWAISKNALKYKPTPRILELAKPLERD